MLPLPEPKIVGKLLEDFAYPRSLNYPLTESYELGGVALNNPNEGLESYVWFLWTDSNNIFLKRLDSDEVITVITAPNISEVDFTFDQNMRGYYTYVSNGIVHFNWYDTEKAAQVTTVMPANIKHGRLSLDDKRKFNILNSDIIFAYQKNTELVYKLQREKFLIEHTAAVSKDKRILWRIGMGVNNRFLFYWR